MFSMTDWVESAEHPGYRVREIINGNCTIQILRPILDKAEREKVERHVIAVAESALASYYRKKAMENEQQNNN